MSDGVAKMEELERTVRSINDIDEAVEDLKQRAKAVSIADHVHEHRHERYIYIYIYTRRRI